MPVDEQSASASVEEAPHARFPHPFHEDPRDGLNESVPGRWGARTLAELRMCRLSSLIRQTPRWWEKMRDPAMRSKWIQEAKEQQKDLKHGEKLTDQMYDYVMDELDGYAELRDEKTGIECGPYHAIFFSDYLIPQDLTEALQRAVKALDDVPEQEKDWHPGSEGRVLDLDDQIDAMFISHRFQWLPSDFQVDDKGVVKLASSYINNIHPQYHDTLVPVIERILEQAVPMWERVLSALDTGPGLLRLYPTFECIRDAASSLVKHREDELERARDYYAWLQSKIDCGSFELYECWPYRGPFERLPEKKFSLAESRIQVNVKLADIVLTPEKPEYPGGIWHVEGTAGECIISTFIYPYDSENIEACDLSFRAATAAPDYHRRYLNDTICTRNLYGMIQGDPCTQDIGSVETGAGVVLRSRTSTSTGWVSPCRLVDQTKPGVRKILIFFLVDPTVNVPSTSVVGPRQRDIVKYTLLQVAHERAASSRLAMLPVELLDYIGSLVLGTMSRAEAEGIRGKLMKERSVMIKSVNTQFFEREFNTCEH
ncbi:hypothetical protein FB45DRAFT_1018187 [Roridomyces roridus]|uniref:Uncharacterized protein n=1 Tax=Roridomyces roridus TaxID=1738132 RepID=A0AAD7CK10_9AGAR|nr:hypothetical protein FB45DRAFT_1018187 [Roridomyces roridus]